MKQRVQSKRKITSMVESQATYSNQKKQLVSMSTKGKRVVTAVSSSPAPLPGISNQQDLSHLRFLTPEQRARYDQFASRGVSPNRYADVSALDKIHLLDNVTEMLTEIGWIKLLTLNVPTYAELVYEFLSTFEYKELDMATREVEEIVFRFSLMGKGYELDEEAVQLIFGWPGIVSYGIPQFDAKAFWRSLTKDESEVYSGQNSKASKIVNPAIRYVYKLLAYSLFGGGRMGTVSKLELAVLYCAVNEIPVDFLYIIGKRIKEVIAKKEGPIMLGWFVTMIAQKLHILDQGESCFTIHPGKILDLPSLVKMHFLRRKGKDYEIIPHEHGSTSLVSALVTIEGHEEGHLSEAAGESLSDRVSGLERTMQELKADIGVVREQMMEMFEYMKSHFPKSSPQSRR